MVRICGFTVLPLEEMRPLTHFLMQIFWGAAYFEIHRGRWFKGFGRTVESIINIIILIAGYVSFIHLSVKRALTLSYSRFTILGAGTYVSIKSILISYATGALSTCFRFYPLFPSAYVRAAHVNRGSLPMHEQWILSHTHNRYTCTSTVILGISVGCCLYELGWHFAFSGASPFRSWTPRTRALIQFVDRCDSNQVLVTSLVSVLLLLHSSPRATESQHYH